VLNTVAVYRLDQQSKAKILLGILPERRQSERGDNTVGMLRLARKEFAETEEDARNIFISYE